MEPLQFKSQRFVARTCEDVLGVGHDEWHPGIVTKVLVSTFAIAFGLLIVFGIYIFIKYLLIRTDKRRISMIGFYILTICDLLARLTILILLNFSTFFSLTNLCFSVLALMLGLFVGTSHTQILVTLTVDLKTLMIRTAEQ